MRRALVPALLALMSSAACQGTPVPSPQPIVAGPPAIPDAQSPVDAPLFVGQNTFAAPLSDQTEFSPPLATVRADGGNSGVVDGLGPLGRAPVTGSAAEPVLPPLLWSGRTSLTSGCQVEIDPGLTKNCLAAVDASTLTVTARWLPPGQDLNLASAVVDDAQRVLVTTRQRHLFVVARPDGAGGTFRLVRDVDLNSHLADGQGLLAAVSDTDGNVWFTSGGPPPSGAPSPDTTVGYVTADDQVVTTTLPSQHAETGLAVDQGNVFLATAPIGPTGTPARGQLYALTAASNQVQAVWRDTYDAGSSAKPGATTRGTGSPVVLLGSRYLALTDNADGQTHLLVYLRGSLPGSPARGLTGTTTTTTPPPGPAPTAPTAPTAPSAPTATTATIAPAGGAVPGPSAPTATTATIAPAGGAVPATVSDPRLVCAIPLFTSGSSAVASAPVGYASGDTNSVIVANGYNAPATLTDPSDNGPANDINQMAAGVSRVDVLPDGSGCRTEWTTALRLKTAPVLASGTGLLYGYTEDEGRAAAGSFIWYFVAVDYRTGRVVWRQRAGAGSTKNDNRQPTMMGANGVLYQTVPLGILWMRDVAQRP